MKVCAAYASSENADLNIVDAHLGLRNVMEPEAAFFVPLY
jgi:hypothetical protein